METGGLELEKGKKKILLKEKLNAHNLFLLQSKKLLKLLSVNLKKTMPKRDRSFPFWDITF